MTVEFEHGLAEPPHQDPVNNGYWTASCTCAHGFAAPTKDECWELLAEHTAECLVKMFADRGVDLTQRYEVETLDPEVDDGTMPTNVETLATAVVGHKIVSVEKDIPIPDYDDWGQGDGTRITLDNGKQVWLVDTEDCCAYTELQEFLLHPDKVDHVITGIGTTEGYTEWHIYADAGDVLKLTVGWSPGNAFYYGYGFNIVVRDP